VLKRHQKIIGMSNRISGKLFDLIQSSTVWKLVLGLVINPTFELGLASNRLDYPASKFCFLSNFVQQL
jgi:hypothetical protein